MTIDEQRIEDAWRRWMNSPEGNNSSWLSFEAGWLARDAEVQALREALTYALHVLEHLKVDNPNPLLPNARWESIDMARAALAGEKGNNND